MIDAVHDRYTDADFGYDPATNKNRRKEFIDAFDEGNRRFEELINSAALDSTPACHVCQLGRIYEKAKSVGEGDRVTLQELVRLHDLFDDLAADQEQIDRKRHEFEERHERNSEASDRLEEIQSAPSPATWRITKGCWRIFSHSPDYNPNSPRMSVERDKFTCDRM